MTPSPTIHLAIDNCFASKRWTRPREWMEFARLLGLRFVEASADTEADALYCGIDYLEDWAEEVSRSEKETDVKVVNLYSGHGTYATLGLGHTDERVRRRIIEFWVQPMIRAAARLNAGLGFYCHAFPDAVLQDPPSYTHQLEQLYRSLSRIASYGAENKLPSVAVEQMYSPHQVPWTVDGAIDLMRNVFGESRSPLYLTIDTGHQTGQGKFLRPDASAILEHARRCATSSAAAVPWLGSRKAHERFDQCARNGGEVTADDLCYIMEEIDRHPFLFSMPDDSNTWSWLESLGCFSPIVHLQQVTGATSSHLPFTPATNRTGLIHPEKVLRSLMTSYRRVPPDGLPGRTRDIYLTIEVFAGAAQTYREIESDLRETVDYWRRYIPRDGVTLDNLVES
jgi:D-erythrulose 1-phosphate 3-epimerase